MRRPAGPCPSLLLNLSESITRLNHFTFLIQLDTTSKAIYPTTLPDFQSFHLMWKTLRQEISQCNPKYACPSILDNDKI